MSSKTVKTQKEFKTIHNLGVKTAIVIDIHSEYNIYVPII